MPLLYIAIWVWTALCQLLLFKLKSLFFPLHAIRERYPRHQEKHQPREEFQKLLKSKQNSVEVF